MKRWHILTVLCAGMLAAALLCLSACGNNSNAGEEAATAAEEVVATESEGTATTAKQVPADPNNLTEEEIRLVFEEVVINMKEFYAGSTEMDEYLYYAGAGDGESAILAIYVPGTSKSFIYAGPAVVENGTNRITITDEASGEAITFKIAVESNGVMTFTLEDRNRYAVMGKCSANDIVNALITIVANAPKPAATAAAESTPAPTE